MRIFRSFGKEGNAGEEERSVVRPTFSYMGKYFISNSVIENLVYYAANKTIGISKISNIDILNTGRGLIIEMDVRIMYGNPIRPLAERLQEQVMIEIEYMTSFNVLSINLNVRGLVVTA